MTYLYIFVFSFSSNHLERLQYDTYVSNTAVYVHFLKLSSSRSFKNCALDYTSKYVIKMRMRYFTTLTSGRQLLAPFLTATINSYLHIFIHQVHSIGVN